MISILDCRRTARTKFSITSFPQNKKEWAWAWPLFGRLFEAHGGTIIAENASDRGARMVVRLPLNSRER
jgi:hypothetical protein